MAMIDVVTTFLACPECKGLPVDQGDRLLCPACDATTQRSLGFWDFLQGKDTLALAGGGSFDLLDDEEKAAGLSDAAKDLSFRELLLLERPVPTNRAERRFAERYWRESKEVGFSHGDAILTKVNAFLSHRGRSRLYPGVALEAAGGHGLLVPDFARYFEQVIFIDCSLQNLVLASRLAKDLSLTNVIFLRADVTKLPIRSASVELVHSSGVIEHVDSPQALVDESLRVVSERGTFVCLSPNRYPISPEAHFRLPLYGIWPERIRKPVIRRLRGLSNEAGTDLLSLRTLRGCFRRAGVRADIFFLPPRLPRTARSTFIRRSVAFLLSARPTSTIVDVVLNKLLLGIAPYHIAIWPSMNGARS